MNPADIVTVRPGGAPPRYHVYFGDVYVRDFALREQAEVVAKELRSVLARVLSAAAQPLRVPDVLFPWDRIPPWWGRAS